MTVATSDARRARRRAQNRARVALHRARDKDGIGIIPVEFDTEALAILLDRAVGRPFNADDRKDLGKGVKELLTRLMVAVTHYGQ
jgi:hypothetical protein